MNQTAPQSLNRYAYVQNNSMSTVDSYGLDACAYNNGNGTWTVSSTLDGDEIDCPGDGIYITTNGVVNGLLTDALGSTVALTDATGNSQVQYSYGLYGILSASGATTTPLRFVVESAKLFV